MLLKHLNGDGYVYSYIEFDIVNNEGILTTGGTYLYIRDLWVHHSISGKDEISQYITELENLDETKKVIHIYWLRTKKDKDGNVTLKRISKAFNREVCLHQKHKE